MSVVSGIMVFASVGEDSATGDSRPSLFDMLDDWIEERGYGQHLVLIKLVGTKHPQFHAAGAGLNHFSMHEEDFASYAMSLPWKYPENFVLVLQPEEGPTRVYCLKEDISK